MAQKLFVGGLAFATTNEGLQDFFTQAGEVASAAVVTDRDTGRSRGFGFVEMVTADGARRAVADLNGRELDGRSLRVELSKPKLDGYANRRGGAAWR
jgi:RNA recognition motif-containing protein